MPVTPVACETGVQGVAFVVSECRKIHDPSCDTEKPELLSLEEYLSRQDLCKITILRSPRRYGCQRRCRKACGPAA